MICLKGHGRKFHIQVLYDMVLLKGVPIEVTRVSNQVSKPLLIFKIGCTSSRRQPSTRVEIQIKYESLGK
jgi:hypothetical protein